MKAPYIFLVIGMLMGVFIAYHWWGGDTFSSKVQVASVIPSVQMAKDYEYSNFGIIIIDSCEYVYGKNGNGLAITHKGNCRFCAERNKK